LMLMYEKIASPAALKRSADDQRRIDEQTSTMSLYQYRTCPFCVKVRMALKRLGLNVQLRDVMKNEADKRELLEKGGQVQVPCLRIQENGGDRWMYESGDIIGYLEERFGSAGQKTALNS
jgi:glutathione S-transferase